jgi:hypothetical protein
MPLTAAQLWGHSAVEPDSTLAEEVADKREQVAGCPPACGCSAHQLLALFERAAQIMAERDQRLLRIMFGDEPPTVDARPGADQQDRA